MEGASDDWTDVLAALITARARFLVVGAHALRAVHGHTVAFIGREALIANKRAAGRLRDLADIEALGGEV